MKSETKFKIIKFLFVISLIISLLCISSTYAKYHESVDTTYEIDIKQWLVVVNNQDIHKKTTLSQVLQPVLAPVSYAKDNILVPGREFYLDVNLDYTHVDVPFTFTLSFEQRNEEERKLADLQFSHYEIKKSGTGITEEFEIVENEGTHQFEKITKTIDPTTEAAADRNRDIKIYLVWNDGADSTMNNLADTQFRGKVDSDPSILNTSIEYKVDMEFKQYIEE